MTDTKTCKCCNQELPADLEHFPRYKDRLYSYCKICHSAKQKEYRERDVEYYRETHNANANKRRQENPEIDRERHRRWTKNNKEHLKLYLKDKYKQDSSKFLIRSHNYESRKRKLANNMNKIQYDFMMKYWDNKCAITGESGKIHLDHWIPLNSKNCPGTIGTNMIPMSRNLNTSKKDTHPYLWLVDRFGKEFADKKLVEINNYFELVKLQGNY